MAAAAAAGGVVPNSATTKGAVDDRKMGLIELVYLYGYSLLPYLPSMWTCVLPYDAIQWSSLALSTIVRGLFVLRNI
jgi:hypothetical protein